MRCVCDRFCVRAMSARGPAAWALYRAASSIYRLPPRRMWETDDIHEAMRLLHEFQARDLSPDVWYDETLCPICREHYTSYGLVITANPRREIVIVSHRGWHISDDVVVIDFRAKNLDVSHDHDRRGSVHAAWNVLYSLPLGVAGDISVTLALPSRPHHIRAIDAYNIAVKAFNLYSK